MPDDKELLDDAIKAREPKAEKPEEPEKQEEPEVKAEEPQGDEPEPNEQAEEEVEQEPGDEPEKPPEKEEEKPQSHQVPLSELLSTRERAQKAEAERERLEREMRETRRQMEELRKAQEPKEKPDIWTDPEAFVKSQVNPVQQAGEDKFQRMSRVVAVDKYGQEAVDTALNALDEHVRTNPLGRYDHERIMNADHPYGELVTWHKDQEARKEFGSDPSAYREKVKETLLEDPEFRKQAMEKWNAQARGSAERPPNTQLPPTLSRTPASKDVPVKDMDDSALLEDALGARQKG